MKKQIDGWAFLGEDGEWKMLHSDFGKVQYQMLEGKLGAGKIVEVRIIDASDDSKDVVVPRELLRFCRLAHQWIKWTYDEAEQLSKDELLELEALMNKLNQILPEKEDE